MLQIVKFVFGDMIRVNLILNTSKLPFKVMEEQYMEICFTWMQTGSGMLTREKYHNDIVNPIVELHFDNHPQLYT